MSDSETSATTSESVTHTATEARESSEHKQTAQHTDRGGGGGGGGGRGRGGGLEGLFAVSLGVLHVLNLQLIESNFEEIVHLLSRQDIARLEMREHELLRAVAGAARVSAAEVCV